ncbi:MAG TPA: hypothetical protein VHC70_02895 [Phycisphaerales bacterium]|jgi:hypothetical protein|nr:hypothetical protein [Phycisphaerales bacterium]
MSAQVRDKAPVSLRPCCIHLRHKLMFVDPRHATPGLVDDSSDSRVFVCQLTQYNLGPDDEPVSPGRCESSGRSCFRGAPEPISPTISAPRGGVA